MANATPFQHDGNMVRILTQPEIEAVLLTALLGVIGLGRFIKFLMGKTQYSRCITSRVNWRWNHQTPEGNKARHARTGIEKGRGMNANGQLIEMLTRSEIFQNYKRAYMLATGMPLTLRPVATWQLPFHGKGGGNTFCAVMAGQSHTCAACLRSQEKLARDAMDKPATRTCAYGLWDIAVPVKLGPATIGLLQTGHMMRRKPNPASFQYAVDHAAKLGVDIANEPARRAFFETPVASQRKLDAVTVLLSSSPTISL